MPSILTARRLRKLAPLSVLAAAACAPAAQTVYLAATPETVLSRLEAAPAGRAQYVVVENTSSQDIFVTGVQLRECRNIKNTCETAVMRVTVPPRQSRRVLTVQVENQNTASAFRYGMSWEVARPSLPEILP